MTKQPVSVNGVVRWKDVGLDEDDSTETKDMKMGVLRQEIGEVLRSVRQRQGRTLREVSHSARVSLGYLSEVERGQKEASSELLASICAALDIPMSQMLREVADRLAYAEGLLVPDTVPSDLTEQYSREFGRVRMRRSGVTAAPSTLEAGGLTLDRSRGEVNRAPADGSQGPSTRKP